MRLEKDEDPRIDRFLSELLRSQQRVRPRPAPTSRAFLRMGKGRSGRKLGRNKKLRKVLPLLLATGLLVLLAGGAFIWLVQDNSWRTPTSYRGGVPRAVLVDELSATVPDPSFIDGARNELRSAGYAVDYYGPADVTVALFRDLPLKGYSLEVLRTHGGASQIYTSEPYSASKYVLEQLNDQVGSVLLNNQLYFAITTKFVQGAMHGTFPGSLVVEMGCSGLAGTQMAQAFLDRGATAFVGWDRAVSASHTDEAIMDLLGALAQGKSLKDAVSLTVNQIGRDPLYQSRLGYYDSTLGPRQKATESLLGLSGLLALIVLPVAAIALITLFPKFFGRT